MSDLIIDGLPYPVVFSADAARRLTQGLPERAAVALVCDRRVAASRAKPMRGALLRAGVRVLGVLGVHGGERCKRTAELASLWTWLSANGADRHTVLVAVGGGTITDLCGFAAATYVRGIEWLAVPTTVLGMADAAIGGKTAIDLPAGKNLAGAFWAPRAVIADLAALATLPRAQLATGLAEIVKAGVIGDPELLEAVAALRGKRATSSAWRDAIVRAARVKVAIVAADPFERGERAALNLGHTLGHALERASRNRLTHGAAVAIGLRGAGLLAVRAGLFSAAEHARLLAVLRGAGLPLQYDRLDRGAIEAALALDKKRRDGQVRFVLPEALGRVRWDVAVDAGEVRAVIDACARPPQRNETAA